MRKNEVISLGVISSFFIIGVYYYPQMPKTIASHWNAQGQADGYMSKFWGLFFQPFLAIGLLLFFNVIPKIDPSKTNIEKFRKYYDGFVVLVIWFLFYLYLLTVLWNIGMRFNMIQLLAPSLGVLFYYSGVLTENAKRNWFIGIRTPWTLSNEKVWDKTSKVGGKLFKIAGVITFFGILFSSYALLFIFLPVILVAVYTIVYSYFEYQKQLK